MTDFKKFPKIGRFHADCIITEKIDGTNAQIVVLPWDAEDPRARLSHRVTHTSDDFDVMVLAGSRTRYIAPDNDNHGFAAWVHRHATTLAHLPIDHYYGEWWGRKIQRGYNLDEKRFTSFRPSWLPMAGEPSVQESCVNLRHAVLKQEPLWDAWQLLHRLPTLYEGPFDPHRAYECLWRLREEGSRAAPGYMNPEGIVVYFPGTHSSFKLTFKDLVTFERGKRIVYQTDLKGVQVRQPDEAFWGIKPRTYHKSQEKKS